MLLSYVTNVLPAPSIIPNSSAINKVPAPTPLRSLIDRSAVHANRVGLLIPVAIPKIIEFVYCFNCSLLIFIVFLLYLRQLYFLNSLSRGIHPLV